MPLRYVYLPDHISFPDAKLRVSRDGRPADPQISRELTPCARGLDLRAGQAAMQAAPGQVRVGLGTWVWPGP